MNHTPITMAGWLGGPVSLRHAAGVPVASFRLACTPRHYSKREDRWVDRETQWLTVTCWRALALNVTHSVSAGDPVVVHGRLEATRWTTDQGEERTGFELEAETVGHDLSHGTARFTKPERAPEPAPETAPETAPSQDDGQERAA